VSAAVLDNLGDSRKEMIKAIGTDQISLPDRPP